MAFWALERGRSQSPIPAKHPSSRRQSRASRNSGRAALWLLRGSYHSLIQLRVKISGLGCAIFDAFDGTIHHPCFARAIHRAHARARDGHRRKAKPQPNRREISSIAWRRVPRNGTQESAGRHFGRDDALRKRAPERKRPGAEAHFRVARSSAGLSSSSPLLKQGAPTGYRPGTSLTDRTGRIPDTADVARRGHERAVPLEPRLAALAHMC